MRLGLADNLGPKLVSLLLGFALWYVVSGEQGAEIAFTVPIEFRDVKEGLEILKESVQQVDVRVRGSSEIVRGLTPQEIQVVVDMSEVGPGKQAVYLTSDEVSAPFGVSVIRVSPKSLEVELDETGTIEARVMPRVVGAPAEGFELHEIKLEPATIRLSGPVSRLVGVHEVTTEPISAHGLREAHSQPVQVLLEDPLIRVSGMSKVVATLDVREERTRVELSGVPVIVSPEAGGGTVLPTSVKVTLSMPKSRAGDARPEDLEAFVSTQGLSRGTHDVPIHVSPRSAEMEVVAVKPARARLSVRGNEKP